MLQANLQNPTIPRIYANAISLGLTPADLVLTLMWNGAPTANISIALPVAKSFADDLAGAVRDYESATGTTVQTLKTLTEGLVRVRGAPSGSP